jgi:hypothetical protein
MKKMIRLLRVVLIKTVLKLKRFDSSNCIIIFSEARGGSTWLMEMMSTLLPVCINWEPLHVENGIVPRDRNFGWRPFVPENDSSHENYLLFKKIHEYKVCSDWTIKYLSLSKIFKCKYVLVKYVRANMLIPYLINKFEFKHKPIFLIRHPIDTCISQIKAFGSNDYVKVHNQVPRCINNERFIEHFEFISSLESDLEVKIANWCINNCPSIDKIDPHKVCVVFYSDLLLDPEKEIKRILISIDLERYIKNLHKVDYRKACSTDFKNDFAASSQTQLNKNLDKLDFETKNKIQSIFDYFNFKLYSAYSSIPNKQYL